MPDYKSIRNHCQSIKHISSTVIDDFLIYFAAQQDKLNQEAESELTRYKHITKQLPEAWFNMTLSQYIAHRVFRKGGLINKYLRHSRLSHLTDQEIDFLKFQKDHPWRFSFAEITDSPVPDFYEMYDVFTDEEYLIYSTGMTNIRYTQIPCIWFNLIAFNGMCWQTFGPISAYSAFEPDDIQFFATELNRGQWFESGQDLMMNVEQNPVPYLLLYSGSTLPRSFHKDDQIIQIQAEFHDDSFDSILFGKEFTKEYNKGVYKLSLNGWDQFPHYSTAYYDEKEELLVLNSMTDRGFRKLIDRLNDCGYDLTYEPDVRINMAMVKVAGDILRKEIKINKYDNLFSVEDPDQSPDELDNINAMLAELIPYVNNGNKPDLDSLAVRYGVDPKTVREIYDQVNKKYGM